VGTRAKESSVEIGAIVPSVVGLRKGGTGISEDDLEEATINPRGDQGSSVALAAPGALVAFDGA
jgi:hypothetical protein